MKECRLCKTKNDDNMVFCRVCGTKFPDPIIQTADPSVGEEKSKTGSELSDDVKALRELLVKMLTPPKYEYMMINPNDYEATVRREHPNELKNPNYYDNQDIPVYNKYFFNYIKTLGTMGWELIISDDQRGRLGYVMKRMIRE